MTRLRDVFQDVSRRLTRRYLKLRLALAGGASANYERLSDRSEAAELDGWRSESVAARQDAAYRQLLEEMHAGDPRLDLRIAADAVRETGLESPSLLEVGCGGGYYSEVFEHLLDGSVAYVGTDYSREMIHNAKNNYGGLPVFVSDAAGLPVRDDAVDIVFNGNALMHIRDYEAAIAESSRVAADWCCFHSVPVVDDETTILRKDAYGEPTIEIVFDEDELLDQFAAEGLDLQQRYRSIDYQPEKVAGSVAMRTYLCRVG
jgi:SAM-dependent methyltransferase